jgi:hypothetical protein
MYFVAYRWHRAGVTEMEGRNHKRAYFNVTRNHSTYLNWVIKYAKQKSHWESETEIDAVAYGVVEKGVDISKPEGWSAIGGRTVAVTGEGMSATRREHFNEAHMCTSSQECAMTDNRGMLMLHMHVFMLE